MKIETMYFENGQWKYDNESIHDKNNVDLILVFGVTDTLQNNKDYEFFSAKYKNAQIVGSSSAGNILGAKVHESSIVATAISFMVV